MKHTGWERGRRAGVCIAVAACLLGSGGAKADVSPSPLTIDAKATIGAIAFTPDGTGIAAAFTGGDVAIYDARTGRALKRFKVRSPDEFDFLAFSDNGVFAVGTTANEVQLHNAGTGTLMRSFASRYGVSGGTAYSANGRVVVSGSGEDSLDIWDAASGKLRAVVSGQNLHTSLIALSPDGALVAVSRDPYGVALIDTATGKTIRLLETVAGARGDDGFVNALAFSPDGERLLAHCCRSEIREWRVADGQLLRTLRNPPDENPDGSAGALAISAKGAVAANPLLKGPAWVWREGEHPAQTIYRDLRGQLLSIETVAISRDGLLLATVNDSNKIDIWMLDPNAAPAAAPPPSPSSSEQAFAPPPAPDPAKSAQAPVVAPGPTPGRRVALVLANAAYRGEPLTNPGVDSALVAGSLKAAGFDVTVKSDLTFEGFDNALEDFARAAQGAEVALFYFAGHGFSVALDGRQENLLMAVDADFQARTPLALARNGETMEHVEQALIGHARATLIFIDACRNVPTLATRGVGGRGFAPIAASDFGGAFVVLSTRLGQTAADGERGAGSPFARAFAAALPTPRLRIEDVYARIREQVRKETSGAQAPDLVRSDLPEGGLVLLNAAP